MNNKKKVFNIIADIFEIKTNLINMESSPNNISNWDSIGMINLILAIEQEFNIKFSSSEISELISVKFIIETLKKKGILF